MYTKYRISIKVSREIEEETERAGERRGERERRRGGGERVATSKNRLRAGNDEVVYYYIIHRPRASAHTARRGSPFFYDNFSH